MKKIVLVGGGSGGHILPSIAILPELKKYFDKVYYIGENNSLEEKIAKKYNLEFYPTLAIKLKRGKIIENLKIPFVLPKAIMQAKKLLKELKPDVIFCKGGYVSLPTTLAGQMLKIPIVVHESDRSLGLTNKICSIRANYVITPIKLKDSDKYIELQNPIREEILHGNKEIIYKTFNLRKNYKNILILGGSLGASSINKVIFENIENLTKKYNILHITGKGKEIEKQDIEGYYPIPYADNIGDFYDVSDLVISRAGAGVVQELMALGKRAILIPLPKDCSRGDQIMNAEKSPYKIINQENLTGDILLNNIENIIDTTPPNKSYDILTTKKIVDIINNSIRENKK